MIDLRTNEESDLWKSDAKPVKSDWLYNFSRFSLQLNYLSDELREKLPPTDSRLRPDQRALENGDTENAIREKHRLEEAQRARRKAMQESQTIYTPSYFEQKTVEETGELIWQSNQHYWRDRELQDWSCLPLIF
jgi:hypothetical protein